MLASPHRNKLDQRIAIGGLRVNHLFYNNQRLADPSSSAAGDISEGRLEELEKLAEDQEALTYAFMKEGRLVRIRENMPDNVPTPSDGRLSIQSLFDKASRFGIRPGNLAPTLEISAAFLSYKPHRQQDEEQSEYHVLASFDQSLLDFASSRHSAKELTRVKFFELFAEALPISAKGSLVRLSRYYDENLRMRHLEPMRKRFSPRRRSLLFPGYELHRQAERYIRDFYFDAIWGYSGVPNYDPDGHLAPITPDIWHHYQWPEPAKEIVS